MAQANGRGGSPLGFRRKKPAVWISEIPADNRIQYERVKRELGVLERARSDGRVNQPSQHELQINEPQTQILHRVYVGICSLNQWLADQLGAAVARARREAPEPLDTTAAGIEMEARIASVLHDRQAELVELREKELETQRDLNYFRRRHDLNRTASYRESPWLFAAILVGMLVLESFLNAFLLRQIAEQGWIGGVVLAGMISVVNIFLGVVAGAVGWRLLGHRFWPQRLIGLGAMLAAHAAALLWNLFVAHFREVAETAVIASQAGQLDIGAFAIDTISHIRTNGWFGLNSLLSWSLFALGLAVHLLVSKESWDDMADRYWDYKPVDLAYRRARVAYEDAVADAKSHALEEARAIIDDLKDQHARQGQSAADITAQVDLAEQRISEVRDAETDWVRQGGMLLKSYRDENAKVRTDPSPGYFGVYPSPEDYRSPPEDADDGPPGAVDLDESRESIGRAVQTLRDAADDAVRTHNENTLLMRQLDTRLAEAIAGMQQRIDELKKTIDHQAEKTVERGRPAERELYRPAPAEEEARG
jgi:hypothetical protein